MALERDTLLEMQRRMLRIRHFDERAAKMVKRGQIPGTVHTSIGQEAQVVGACMALADGDYMTGNHRSHGHPIGKGSPLGPLMAELVGKSGGVCGGKGGSLHLADFAVGSLGESGIVGSSIPIATGAALSSKVLGTGRAFSSRTRPCRMIRSPIGLWPGWAKLVRRSLSPVSMSEWPKTGPVNSPTELSSEILE